MFSEEETWRNPFSLSSTCSMVGGQDGNPRPQVFRVSPPRLSRVHPDLCCQVVPTCQGCWLAGAGWRGAHGRRLLGCSDPLHELK